MLNFVSASQPIELAYLILWVGGVTGWGCYWLGVLLVGGVTGWGCYWLGVLLVGGFTG